MEIIVSAVIGYLLGSPPTAYLLVKLLHKKDVTIEGSGNVGALNSLEVSSSKITGSIVLLIDFLKGVLSAFIPIMIFGDYFIIAATGLIAAVFSHCYSPWLKFKGGRGLATAAGGAIVIAPVILVVWVIFWVISYLFKKHIHFSNVIATVLTTAIAWTSAQILNNTKWLNVHPAESSALYSILISIMMLIILSRHIKTIKSYLNYEKKKVRGGKDE